MNYTKEDIEYYLMYKEYQELTPEELGFISSEVKSEQEFNQLKKLMVSLIDDKDNKIDIQPDPAIKSVLMKEFREKSKINKVWYNSLLIQLFPKEKSIYRMPGVQLAGIAASLLLVLNIFILNDPTKEENYVVVNNNETNEEEKITSVEDENGLEEKSKTGSFSENNESENNSTELPAEEVIAKIDLKDETNSEILVEVLDDEVSEIEIVEEFDGTLMESVDISTGASIEMNEYEVADNLGSDSISLYYEDVKELNETLTLEGFTEPTVTNNISTNTSIEEMEINTDMKSVEISKGRVRNKNNVIISRSLNDDKELIDLFFTAL